MDEVNLIEDTPMKYTESRCTIISLALLCAFVGKAYGEQTVSASVGGNLDQTRALMNQIQGSIMTVLPLSMNFDY